MRTIKTKTTGPINMKPARKYPASLRLWHWTNTIVISGSLITVLINSTVTDEQPISALVQAELQKSGVTITGQQANSVAHGIGDDVWNIHVYFGYALAVLLLFRIGMEFFQRADQKFIFKLTNAYRQFKLTGKKRKHAKHIFIVKAIYASFYGLLTIMAITGLFLAFEDLLAPLKVIRHSVKEVHGFCMYLVLAFIIVHITGVFLAERSTDKGIISDMISGGEDRP
jgi:cytochrome b